MDEVHVGVPGFQAAVLDVEAQLGELRERRLGIGDAERNVIEVVGDPVVSGDEREGTRCGPSNSTRPSSGLSTARSGGSSASASSRSNTRRPMRESGPGARSGSAANSVSFPRRASAAHEREIVRAVDDVHAQPVNEEVRQLVAVGDPEGDVVKRLDLHTAQITHDKGCNAGKSGEIPCNGSRGVNGERERQARVLLLAARQPDLRGLLEEAGFTVEAERQPPKDEHPGCRSRGRLPRTADRPQPGRNAARHGIPVVEVLTSEPTTPSTAGWLRLSSRISKPDLVQVVRAVADWARGNGHPPSE